MEPLGKATGTIWVVFLSLSQVFISAQETKDITTKEIRVPRSGALIFKGSRLRNTHTDTHRLFQPSVLPSRGNPAKSGCEPKSFNPKTRGPTALKPQTLQNLQLTHANNGDLNT